MFINIGDGRFEQRALPTLAQLSPVQGVSLADFDADGDLDALLAQNFFSAQRETGLMDGGLSLILANDGTGTFEALWPRDSGVVIPAPGTATALIDMNQDKRPDLLEATNNSALHALANANQGGQPFSVTLKCTPGNPTCVGARVVTKRGGGASVAQEVGAGSGYMGQASATVFLGAPEGDAIKKIEVRWPDGRDSVHEVAAGTTSMTLSPGSP